MRMHSGKRVKVAGIGVLIAAMIAFLAACGSSEDTAPASNEDSPEIGAGWVSSIDQLALPASLDQGFFEDAGLNVKIADPFATGVDMLNALATDQIQFAQVGAPLIGAVLKGADYVVVGNYSGSASQFGIDETLAMVAGKDSGIVKDDPKSWQGKKIGVTVGSINYLYLLAALEKNGMTEKDIEVVNMAPADMAVAVQKGGVDAAVAWDPFPMMMAAQSPGSSEVLRGGGYIAYIGYIVAKRDFVEDNPELVEKYLTARAQGDQWIRNNAEQAAELATRWLPNLDVDIAKEAMQYNIKQLDPRISACNYAALNWSVETLANLGVTTGTFDVNEVFMPAAIGAVEKDNPDLFEGLSPIPESAVVADGFTFDPKGNQCPQS